VLERLEDLEGEGREVRERAFFQHLRGAALIDLDRRQEAAEVYRRILARNGRDAVAAVRLATLVEEQGASAEADALLAIARPRADSNWEIQTAIGDLRLRRGEVRAALACYERAAELAGGREPWILLGTARARRALGDLEGAHAILLEAVSLDPNGRSGRLELAELQLARDRTMEALNLLRPMLPPAGADPRAMSLAVRVHLVRGELRDAGALADELLEAEPDAPDSHRVAGEVYRRKRAFRKGRAAFERALALGGEDARTLCGLARLLLSAEGTPVSDPVRALELADRASRLDPRRADPALLRAEALHALERNREAREVIEAALSNPDWDPAPFRALRDTLPDGR
jgi:tetratricopeptide (TPR) repeat protein